MIPAEAAKVVPIAQHSTDCADLAAQREYVACMARGVEFSARERTSNGEPVWAWRIGDVIVFAKWTAGEGAKVTSAVLRDDILRWLDAWDDPEKARRWASGQAHAKEGQ